MKNETYFSKTEQEDLFEKCVAEQLNLYDELANRSLSYDSLRYINSPEINIPQVEYHFIDEIDIQENNIPAISFFAGAGGFDIGFKYAGYTNLASIEFNRIFCETLKHNFPEKIVIGPPDSSGDVKNREEIFDILSQKLGIESPFEGVFHGGPPCQPFSIASNQRFSRNDENFKRVGFEHTQNGNLLFDYVWYITTFKPKVFIIENVAGLLEMDKGQQVARAISLLVEAGYTVAAPKVVNMAHYGIPQNRNRVIVIGSRTDNEFIFPKKHKQLIPCHYAFEKGLDAVPNHETREHKADSVIRYARLGYGQRDHLGRVDRLNPALPSKTVIAGGVKGGGRSHLHPYIPRTLSVRESARLQTFPDDYVFTGPIARQFTQVGNAVPPLFAFQLAEEIRRQFYDSQRSNSVTVKKAEQIALEF